MNIVRLLFCIIFCGFNVNASSPENDRPLSPPRRHDHSPSWRHQSCGDYYLKKPGLDVDDILSILHLLEINPQFNSAEPNEIANDDLYCLKAYFEYTPKNYTNRKLEVIESKNKPLPRDNMSL